MFRPVDMWNDPKKRLEITTLKSAVEHNRIEQIRNSLNRYGLPQGDTRLTDYSVLKLAIQSGKTEIAKLIINAGCRLNLNDNGSDYSPLALAIITENKELTALLLRKNANLGAGHNGISKVLHLAARKQSLKMLQFLFRYQFNVNHISNGKTPFQVFLESSYYLDNPNDIDIVKLFLKEGASIDFKINNYQSVLHRTIKTRNIDIIRAVLQKTNNINEQDINKYTALHILLNQQYPEESIINIVELLIWKGINLNIQDKYGNTAYHLAAKYKYLQIFQTFLTHQWNINCCNEEGSTVLNLFLEDSTKYSKSEFYLKLVEYLLKQESLKLMKNKKGETALHIAAANKQNRVLNELLSMPIDINAIDSNGCTTLYNFIKKLANNQIVCKEDVDVVKKMISKGADPVFYSEHNETTYTPIHFALQLKNKAIILAMLECTFDFDKFNKAQGRSILHFLCTEIEDWNAAAIAEICIKKGATVDPKDWNTETPLHLAAKGKYLRFAKILLQYNARATELDSNRNSALHLMCTMQSHSRYILVEEDLTALFISKGCDVNARNNCGMTPLLLAAESESANMTGILMKYGAILDCTVGENLDMPIHLAAKHNHQQIVEQLIQCGIDVNVRRKDRKTALHLSAAHKVSNVTRLLLENGADTDLKDNNGKTPLHYASWYESLDNINELLDYGADVNAEDNFQTTPLKYAQRSNNTWTKLHYHIVKMQIAKMPVTQRNERCIRKCTNETDYVNEVELEQFESIAVEETLQMGQVPIAIGTKLADVFKMSANKLSTFTCNEDFQKLVNAEDFKGKFPIYTDLVKARYRKGIARSERLLSTRDAFRKILGLALSDICCEAIFRYLDNETLCNLNEAGKIRDVKRKRLMDNDDESIPAKRIRILNVYS